MLVERRKEDEELKKIYRNTLKRNEKLTKRLNKNLISDNLSAEQIWGQIDELNDALLPRMSRKTQNIIAQDDLSDDADTVDKNAPESQISDLDEKYSEDEEEDEEPITLYGEEGEDFLSGNELFEDNEMMQISENDACSKPSSMLKLLEQREVTSNLTEYQQQQVKLRNLIEQYEDENLGKKSWQLSGEVQAKHRPEDSLLNEYLHFDNTVITNPLVTPELNEEIEKLIKQRIKDKAWDDVERKTPQFVESQEFKLTPAVSGEKSKKSLAEIYEANYLSKLNEQKGSTEIQQKHEESSILMDDPNKKLKLEISKEMTDVFEILDSLSKYFYTPHQPKSDEIQIISNCPSLTIEEPVPITVASNSADLLAPEEITTREEKLPKHTTEVSKEEKKTLRAKKKLKKRSILKNKQTKLAHSPSQKAMSVSSAKKAMVMKQKIISSKSGASKQTSTQFFSRLQQQKDNMSIRKKPQKNKINSKALKL